MTLAEALASSNPRLGIFFRLHIDPIARLWLGIGHCEAGMDAVDGDGATYEGLGEITNLPAFQQLINGTAERVEFRLSGVSQRAVALAASEASDVKGVALLVGLGAFDKDWQLVADPVWLRRLVVDYLSIAVDQTGSGESLQTIRSLSLSARSAMTGRRRPALSFFTDDDQQTRSPGDRFCEHAPRYQSVDKIWPKFT